MIVVQIIIVIILLCIWHDVMSVLDNQKKLAKMIIIIAEALEKMEGSEDDG